MSERAIQLLDELIRKWSDPNDSRQWSNVREPIDELAKILPGSVRIYESHGGYVLDVRHPRDARIGIEHAMDMQPTNKTTDGDSLAARIANMKAEQRRQNPMRPDQLARVVQMLKGWRDVAESDGEKWITRQEAANIIGIDPGNVTKQAGPEGSGKPILDNGESGRDRKYDRVSVHEYAAKKNAKVRADQDKPETTAEVERKARKAGI